LTSGDLEHLKEMITLFGLEPLVVPDIADSLDGHLTDRDFSPLTQGGTRVPALATLGDAAATLVVGGSMAATADTLARRTGVPELQDAMLDTHFMLGTARFGVAADADLLLGLSDLLASMGAETVAAVASSNAPALQQIGVDRVKIGDLEDLEAAARERGAEVLIGNSHAAQTARRLGLPLLRAGFPLYDQVGGYQRTWIGYKGARQTLFDLANLLLSLDKGGIRPYRSRLSQKPPSEGAPHEERAWAS